MKFSALLAAVGLQPKTLTEARETLEPAKATLESVNALFSTAGLNLETLLAAGPDSLKAHLETCSVKAEEFSALETQISEKQKALETITGTLAVRDNTLSAFAETFAAIGMADITNKTPAAEVTAAFQTHVAKQVVLANAKAGHPPVHQIDVNAAAATQDASDAEIAKEYSAQPAGPARLAFYTKHAAALQRVYDAQNRRDE